MLHLDDIIELCLSLVCSEEKQDARQYVEWAAAALRSNERTTLPSQAAENLGLATLSCLQQGCAPAGMS